MKNLLLAVLVALTLCATATAQGSPIPENQIAKPSMQIREGCQWTPLPKTCTMWTMMLDKYQDTPTGMQAGVALILAASYRVNLEGFGDVAFMLGEDILECSYNGEDRAVVLWHGKDARSSTPLNQAQRMTLAKYCEEMSERIFFDERLLP